MSIRVLNLVWEHSKQKGSALILLLAIADFADDNGVAFPGVETLAAKSRMSERNTRYVLAQLEDSKELAIERGAGQGGTHRYRVMVTPNLELFGGAKSAGAKFAGEATQRRQGVQPASERGATAIAPEPSLTIKEPSVKGGGGRRTPLPDGFAVSDRVRTWAREKGFEPYLELHFEHFLGYCRANRKLYVDWDEALKNCIRADWGGVRRQVISAARRGDQSAGKGWWSSTESMMAMAKELNVSTRGLSAEQLRAEINRALERRAVPA